MAHQKTSGNPIIQGKGVCDPHIRIFNDKAYLYATHDKSAENKKFIMEDWWIWSSSDLVDWKYEATINPVETYYGKPDASCWAVDAIERNGKYYFYFSRGPYEIVVMKADTPIGPWHDPIGKALISEGDFETAARDPGVFKDDDGECYMVFGTFDFYIGKLNKDMASFAETPQIISINKPEGTYGKGKTDDKPYLHKVNDKYYLSWGCFYSIADDIYGPYDCYGSFIFSENVCPELRDTGEYSITRDRHGSFFEWKGQWYFIGCEMGQTKNKFFRDSSIAYVNYDEKGLIEPIKIELEGVRLPNLKEPFRILEL
jgi:arabinoxylan arabinofuranohydrolase